MKFKSKFKLWLKIEMQLKPRVELRLKVKILYKMSNWDKDTGWSRKKNGLITLGHHTQVLSKMAEMKLILLKLNASFWTNKIDSK